MAGTIGLATPTQQQYIYQFLRENFDKIFFEGQAKELFPSGHGSYQDGGYWATPLDKILPFVARFNSTMACDLLSQVCIGVAGRPLVSDMIFACYGRLGCVKVYVLCGPS